MNSVCLHRKILDKYRFNETLSVWEDNNLWIKILTEFPFIQIQEYTTVCVDHVERGGNKLFKEGDLSVLENYRKSINDLFRFPGISKFLTKKEKKDFLFQKYLTVALVASWNGKLIPVVKCLSSSFKLKPQLVFKPVFYKVIKEYVYSLVKGRNLSA
jgi:hypothetical protein